MVATHSVKINGVWYRPGEEIKGKAEDKNTSAFSFCFFNGAICFSNS